ncbi:MAG: hypothetical protein K0U68_03380 [Gammaproteobacteria bacterium]|nr:hypothetical protein [Gammaproteobacteria bacterium]
MSLATEFENHDKPQMTLMYSIEARSYDLKGLASHNFWVLRDETGERVAQLHGLATDRTRNRFKPLGYFNDRLGFYEFRKANHDPSFIFPNQTFRIVIQAEKSSILKRWQHAASQIETLNQLDLNYSPFGLLGLPITNSNSAYHLYARLLGLSCYRFPGVMQPGIGNDLSYCCDDATLSL